MLMTIESSDNVVEPIVEGLIEIIKKGYLTESIMCLDARCQANM